MRRRATLSVVIRSSLCLSLALLSCGSPDSGPPCPIEGPTPDLAITIVDASGAQICGAFVALKSVAQSQTYHPSGRDTPCNLYSARIPPDTYTLSIMAKGFEPYAKPLVIVYADERCGVPATATQTVTLTPVP